MNWDAVDRPIQDRMGELQKQMDADPRGSGRTGQEGADGAMMSEAHSQRAKRIKFNAKYIRKIFGSFWQINLTLANKIWKRGIVL